MDCTTWSDLLANMGLKLYKKKLYLDNTIELMVGVVT